MKTMEESEEMGRKKTNESAASESILPGMVRLWTSVRGDDTLRLDYNLNRRSTVFDLGGHTGQWTKEMYSRYSCNIRVFEPVDAFADRIEERFRGKNKIILHRFGLAGETGEAEIILSDTASSIYKKNGQKARISLVKASGFIDENNIQSIDLMKINIEGAEYDLLEHLIDSNVVRRIKNLQIQFHDFGPDAENRRKRIQSTLNETHYLTYQYDWVWENWRRKRTPKNMNGAREEMGDLYRQVGMFCGELSSSREEVVRKDRDLQEIRAKLRQISNEYDRHMNSRSYRLSRLFAYPWRLLKRMMGRFGARF